MSGQEYLDKLILDADRVDFDAYLHPQERAKIRDASTYREQVKAAFLNPETESGLRLPWQKATEFRFRDSELTIWTGYNGHKKSMMLGYIFISLIHQGAKGLIASLEMAPRKTLKRMVHQWVGNGEPTVPYQDRFFAAMTGSLWLYDQVGTVKPDRMIAVARYAATELGVNHIVIDSLMKCGIGSDDYNAQKGFIDALTAVCKDTGAHIHLIAHSKKPEKSAESIPSSKYGVKGTSEITDMADNVIVCFTNQATPEEKASDEKKNYDQMLIVEKQRNGESEPKYKFHFDEGSLQFKPYETAARMTPEDWELCRWR